MPTVELIVNMTTLSRKTMARVDDINAKIAALQEELKDAMLKEKANVLAKMKADIKLYDFKGLFKSRVTQNQVNEFLARKADAAAKSPAVKKSVK
jgi:uncharacterized membrane protein